MGVAHWDEVKAIRREAGPMRFTASDLGTAAGSRNVGLRRYRLEAGDRPTPPHVHGAEEEIFYVLSGSGLSWQDGETFEIRAGDCIVHRAAEEAHTIVAGDDGLDVLVFGQRIPVEVGYLPRAEAAWLWPTWVETASAIPWEYDWSQAPEPWQREIAAGELELPRPGDRPANIVNVEDIAAEFWGTSRPVGNAAGSRKTGLWHVALPPRGQGAPAHCHSAEEELFVILDGDATLELTPSPVIAERTPREEIAVRAGHVVGRPPGTGIAHAFRPGERGLTYLAYGTREPNDITYYPEDRKIAFRGVKVAMRVDDPPA